MKHILPMFTSLRRLGAAMAAIAILSFVVPVAGAQLPDEVIGSEVHAISVDGEDPLLGDLNVAGYAFEMNEDRFVKVTVEVLTGNFYPGIYYWTLDDDTTVKAITVYEADRAEVTLQLSKADIVVVSPYTASDISEGTFSIKVESTDDFEEVSLDNQLGKTLFVFSNNDMDEHVVLVGTECDQNFLYRNSAYLSHVSECDDITVSFPENDQHESFDITVFSLESFVFEDGVTNEPVSVTGPVAIHVNNTNQPVVSASGGFFYVFFLKGTDPTQYWVDIFGATHLTLYPLEGDDEVTSVTAIIIDVETHGDIWFESNVPQS